MGLKAAYDVAIIGSGPSGQTAAIELAREGKKVALTERAGTFGGSSLHVGTIPSKTLREAVISLTGGRMRQFGGQITRDSLGQITYEELKSRVNWAIKEEQDVLSRRMARLGVDLFFGQASFVSDREFQVRAEDEKIVSARKIIIAVGSKAARPANISFDGRAIIDSDEIFADPSKSFIPAEMIILGGGVIGMEYATIFARLGVKVRVLNRSASVLSFVDDELLQILLGFARGMGIQIHNDSKLAGLTRSADGKVEAKLESGETITADLFVSAAGRVGNTAGLDIEKAGLSLNERGLIAANERYETAVPGIYAVGDVIGYPSLAASSKQQGREAARHILGLPVKPYDASLLPTGIYTIPEISYVGATERELIERKVDYVKGEARYDEISKSAINGAREGIFKLLFEVETGKLVGAGAAGELATEAIHIAQAAAALGGTIDYFEETVFNYPTFSEGIKLAALDAAAQIRLRSRAGKGAEKTK